jgi:hypothetical protein
LTLVSVLCGRLHRLTILTRNIRHFAPLNVPARDPFKALPP